MRRILPAVAIAAAAAVLAACGSSGGGGTGGSSAAASPSASATTAACSPAGLAAKHELVTPGVLTVGTDSPAFTPWFVGNNPANGKGYESAVAFAVAKEMGFTPSQVTWIREPFSNSYAPGPKKFDFDINEISFTP